MLKEKSVNPAQAQRKAEKAKAIKKSKLFKSTHSSLPYNFLIQKIFCFVLVIYD